MHDLCPPTKWRKFKFIMSDKLLKKNSEVQSVIGIQNSISRQSSWPRKKPVSNNLTVCTNRG